MTGQMNAKVRLVTCPRCRQVLPEFPEISVYSCGGCGTVLQAKHRKPDTKVTELHSAETGEDGKKEPDNAPEKKEISHLNQEYTISSKEELLADASPSQFEDNVWESKIKQARDKSFSAELPVLPVLSYHENEDLSLKLSEQIEQDENKGTLGQDTGEGEQGSCDGCAEWHGGRISSDDLPSSMELTYHGTSDSSPEPQAHTALDKVKRTSNDDKIEHGDCERVQINTNESSNFLSKVPLMIGDKHEESDSSPKCKEHGEEVESLHLSQQDNTSNKCGILENLDYCREISSSTEVTCYEPPSAAVEPSVKVDKDLNGHNFESLKAEDTLDNMEMDSIDAAESPLSEHILLDNVISPDNQHLELYQKTIPQDSERASSVDSLDNLLVTNSISELGLKDTDLSKSSTTRSYRAYEGSVSSYYGIEDQNHGRFLKPPRRKFKHSALVNPVGSLKQDEPRAKDYLGSKSEMHFKGILETGVDGMLSSKSEVQHQPWKSLTLQEKNHLAMKYTKQNLYDSSDPRTFRNSVGSRMRARQEEYAPQLPFHPRFSLASQRNEILSSYQYNGLQHHSGLSSDTPSYAELDEMKLLRMVLELKDELNRIRVSNSRLPAKFAGEKKHTSMFYNHLAPAEEMYADLHHSRYRGRCSQVKGLSQLHEMSRIAFSGNAEEYRQVDCSCLYCCPQDWHCSTQLPSRAIYCNNAHFLTCSSQTGCRGPSTSSSPQHYTSSQFSVQGCGINSNDQRQRSEMKRLHTREKYRSTKQYLRPIAGGIPIVACFHCSKLLQLPADFLLSGRRCHQLRCNACRKIMKFSLQNGKRLAPCTPGAIAPPPSTVGDSVDSIDQRDLAASHCNKCPRTQPPSYSDDYGLSIDRSCSIEWKPSQNIPRIVQLESNMQNRKISSGSSFVPFEDRKMKRILGSSQLKQKNSMENIGSAGSSRKASKSRISTSEIEEVPPTSGPPLHRLMGYSSPSEVIKP